MRQSGFGEQVNRFEQGRCTTCNNPIDMESFHDDISRKEYAISGMCQKCQDKVFKREKTTKSNPKVKKCRCKK